MLIDRNLEALIEASSSLQVVSPVGVIAEVRVGIIIEQLAVRLKKDNTKNT